MKNKIKIGDNIKDIREFEKRYKRSYVAEKLNISTRAYANIENNIADITISRLEEIAEIFDCTPFYIISYGRIKEEFYHNIHSINNNAGNKGTIYLTQNNQNQHLFNTIRRLQDELLQSQKEQIALLEKSVENNENEHH